MALFASLVFCFAGVPSASAQAFDHSPWDRILKQNVTGDGRVDYAALKASRAEFDGYVAQIAARSPESHPQDFSTAESQLAYWMNAYNALTIKGVVDNWPTQSVRDLGFLFSFFRRDDYTAGGKKVSLNYIEHDVIRKKFAEPRIHFALVCASLGCPKLRREAYTAERLEEQLEDGARYFINEPRNLSFDAARNRVTVSKIFDWYGGDFEKHMKAKGAASSGNLILDYVRPYANDANRRALDALKKPGVSYADYSWEVNATSVPAK
jgi:hypothetical protein